MNNEPQPIPTPETVQQSTHDAWLEAQATSGDHRLDADEAHQINPQG